MLKTKSLTKALENIINKDNRLTISRFQDCHNSLFNEEVLYAIEVKFIHPFNARQINMLHEVIKDDQKLWLSYHHSNGFIRPINLVFCSSPAKESRGGIMAVIDHIKEYVRDGQAADRGNQVFHHPSQVATIFIESYFGNDDKKQTKRPMGHIPGEEWAVMLADKINAIVNIPGRAPAAGS